MTTNNTLRLLLLVLCLATVITTVSSCTKHNDLAQAQPTVANSQEAYFSHVKFFTDGRKPATDTIWTLHLTSQQLVDTYQAQNGYVYTQASTFTERGVLWHK